jgi:hypothetical protein
VDEHLYPAVRDIAATGSLFALVGVAVLAVGLAVDHPGEVVTATIALLVVSALLAPRRVRRETRRIVTEAREAPEAPAAPELSPAIWTSALFVAAAVALALLVSMPAGLVGGVLLAGGGAELLEASSLRRWERDSGRRLLYRAAYRWEGTNGRAFGRGWFDPANFVSS